MNIPYLLQRTEKALWIFFLVALPITSFPFLPAELGGKTQVRPLSIYPLLILIILVTLPRLLKKSLPITFIPLFVFIIAALMSSIFSLSLGIEAFKGVTVTARILRSLITLAIGVSIYLTTVLIQRDWQDLKSSLRWLYIGFMAVLAWGTLQSLYIIYFFEGYYNILNKIQSFISTQNLYQTRISGFTYEPKWFAEQITFLLMPWLMASVLTRRSVFRWHYRWITIELILLVWSAYVLIFTYSRTGLVVLVILTFVSVLLLRSVRKPRKRLDRRPLHPLLQQRWMRIVEATLAVLVIVVIAVFAGSQNAYFSRLWRYWGDPKSRNKTYLEYIAFGQRSAYAETALKIFENHPILGVGLGNYALFFDPNLPNQPYRNSPEIIRQLTPSDRGNQLITPKNLYARLLAETGLLGTLTFSTFVLAVFGCAIYLFFAPLPKSKFWGIAGLLGMIAFASIVFSTDSFAIPNLWVIFGLITAAARFTVPSKSAKSAQELGNGLSENITTQTNSSSKTAAKASSTGLAPIVDS